MLFNSWGYLLFLLVAVPTHWLLPHRYRTAALGFYSLLFYAMWRWEFALLMVFSACVDFMSAHRIQASDDERVRKAWLCVSLVINLGLLFAFKYAYFVSDNLVFLSSLLGYEGHGLRDLGFQIVLPLGISFYTFQTISYTFDVYRRVIEPTRSFSVFLTYVIFWPQLIASQRRNRDSGEGLIDGRVEQTPADRRRRDQALLGLLSAGPAGYPEVR